jgi:hypothetical protein
VRKEAATHYFEVLYWSLPERTEENHKNLGKSVFYVLDCDVKTTDRSHFNLYMVMFLLLCTNITFQYKIFLNENNICTKQFYIYNIYMYMA